ncbi:MAG: iron-sulfur cluster repair di-iron protein [Phycisphaerales bacterium]
MGELVTRVPSRSRIFERLGIDFCCGGQRSLREACDEVGLDAGAVVRMLDAIVGEDRRADGVPFVDPAPLSLTDLADHIESTHHLYLRDELPRIQRLFTRALNAHAIRHPWLQDASRVFEQFTNELDSHILKEEQILFPMIRAIDRATEPVQFHCGSLAAPIRVLESEHENAGSALKTLRRLTGDFEPPVDACTTVRALLDALAELEADMHQHVHKENNVLFPRAIEREEKLRLGIASGN